MSQQSNALMPKLPFMRQGYKIADFGKGYSQILKRTPPMSPDQLNSQTAGSLMSPYGDQVMAMQHGPPSALALGQSSANPRAASN